MTTRTSTSVAEVTIRGTLGAVSSSARVLTLAQPVGGTSSVIVSLDTEVLRAGGARATLADLAAGAGVEVTGRPGTPGTLAARRIVLL